ncbi:hypothetical protein VSR82_04115 [Burkholderia sp. JPY481]|uniref:hypothetical protein n=1 Tax=Paraburkholderia sp. JPY465 TaxID=3042285 RepID=UPI00317004E9
MKIDAARPWTTVKKEGATRVASPFDVCMPKELKRYCARAADDDARGANMRRNAGHRVIERTRN